jgi:hypothetical protein
MIEMAALIAMLHRQRVQCPLVAVVVVGEGGMVEAAVVVL